MWRWRLWFRRSFLLFCVHTYWSFTSSLSLAAFRFLHRLSLGLYVVRCGALTGPLRDVQITPPLTIDPLSCAPTMEHFWGGRLSAMPSALSSSSSCSPSCSPSSSPSAPSHVLSEGPISFLHSYWMSLSRLSLRALLRSGSSWLLTVVSSDRAALSRSFFLLRVHQTQTTIQKIQRTLKTTHNTGTK